MRKWADLINTNKWIKWAVVIRDKKNLCIRAIFGAKKYKYTKRRQQTTMSHQKFSNRTYHLQFQTQSKDWPLEIVNFPYRLNESINE